MKRGNLTVIYSFIEVHQMITNSITILIVDLFGSNLVWAHTSTGYLEYDNSIETIYWFCRY